MATPIGNLEDITLRALRILRTVDYILCEDTRVTGKLLSHYKIEATLRRYDAHTSERTHEEVINDVLAGKKVALVSDAGTPGVSDPGVLLIERAHRLGARLEVIPGPSAVTSAISLAGIAGNQFTFSGFVPQKKGRQTFFERLPTLIQPVVFFESTHRIMKTLVTVGEMYPNATVYLARELTKLHEELLIGKVTDLLPRLEVEPVKQKGEFVVLVDTR